MIKYNKDEIENLAYGNWANILTGLGVLNKKQTANKGQPCPLCGGTDRYNFSDYAKAGNYFCRGCGAGNGWTLIKKIKRCDFPQALELVAEYLAIKPLEMKKKKLILMLQRS